MQFKDIIGQESVKQKLLLSVQENHAHHAQLFLGPAGSGKFALALAYAQYILCPNRTATDSCGVCPTCQKISKLQHPDLHFVIPTATTKKVTSNPETESFLTEWREYVDKQKGYVSTSSWYSFLDIENKQGFISVRDAATLIRKLGLKSYEGDYKITIIWMAEKMRVEPANKLLKLLEEPPEKTMFILVAEDQEELLATIRSRTSLVKIPRIGVNEIKDALIERFDCTPDTANDAAILSDGNWLNAIRYINETDDKKYFFHTFQQWMRLCFKAAITELIDFVNNVKSIGRERQIELLEYGLRVVRNSLLLNNNLADFVMLPEDEKKFNTGFAPFVNAANLVQISELLEEASRQIERNGNPSLIFLDTSFKMVKLLRLKA